MKTLKKQQLQDFKTASSSVFVLKPSLASIRQNSKEASPKKTHIKTKYYTEGKTNALTEGIELAVGNISKKSGHRWSQEKQLPIIKSCRDSQKRMPMKSQFTSVKKKSKGDGENIDERQRARDRIDNLKTEDSRKRKFKSMDAFRQIDDEEGDLIVCAHDNLGSRYEVLSAIGRGTFGQVFKAFDHKVKEYVALKVIKNDQKFTTQARVEVKLLRMINQEDLYRKSNIIEVKDSFMHKNHMCITFELLHISLYDFLKEHNFMGFSLDLVRRIAIQVLQALLFLSKHKVIHCDLKPQNILLKQPNKSGIKVIDMGSSCLINERIYNYIQSRFYRAPEIILGTPYSCAIDMWSFGCIMAELSSGQALFPGSSELEQMDRFVEVLGLPPKNILDHAPRKKKFFEEEVFKGKRIPGGKNLDELTCGQDKSFSELVRRCLEWDPEKRITPSEALLSKWILDALPPEIKQHHVSQIKTDHPQLFD